MHHRSAGRGSEDGALCSMQDSQVNAKPRVLVVEDEAVIGLDLAQLLGEFGYEVVGIAASGERAQALAAASRPDLILMDIVIKGPRDGIETARAIRAEIDLPVVFLTAYSDAGTLERVGQVAPYGYLVKPFRPSDLRTTLEVARLRHRLEQRLADGERWFSSTLRCLGEAVIATDRDGRVQFMNPVAEVLVDCRPGEVMGVRVEEFFRLFDDDNLERRADPVSDALANGQPTRKEMGSLRRGTGDEAIPVEVQASPIRDDRQQLLGAVLVVRDISERRRSEAALARLAHLDGLTGLPNRAALLPQLEAMISNANRLGSLLAVLFLDLDGFKDVNDSFGHRVGDQLLVQVARRLKDSLRVADFAARLGGDEFVVLVGNLAKAEMADTVGRKLIDALSRPYDLDGHAVVVTVSIGISLCPIQAAEANGLLRLADGAMYQAKRGGKNRFLRALDDHDAGIPPREDAPAAVGPR